MKIRRHESCLVASENAMKISNYFCHRSEAERAASARALRSERKKKNGRKKRADPFLSRSSCARCMEKVVSMCKCAAEEFPHEKATIAIRLDGDRRSTLDAFCTTPIDLAFNNFSAKRSRKRLQLHIDKIDDHQISLELDLLKQQRTRVDFGNGMLICLINSRAICVTRQLRGCAIRHPTQFYQCHGLAGLLSNFTFC